MKSLGIRIQSINQKVETLSGGQRQAVAVARAAAWGRKVVVLDEPTAALGVRETGQVLDLILRVRDHGLSVVLISHNMPDVFQIADRIHIHRLGRRAAVVSTKSTTRSDVVGVMTGALPADAVESALLAGQAQPTADRGKTRKRRRHDHHGQILDARKSLGRHRRQSQHRPRDRASGLPRRGRRWRSRPATRRKNEETLAELPRDRRPRHGGSHRRRPVATISMRCWRR